MRQKIIVHDKEIEYQIEAYEEFRFCHLKLPENKIVLNKYELDNLIKFLEMAKNDIESIGPYSVVSVV